MLVPFERAVRTSGHTPVGPTWRMFITLGIVSRIVEPMGISSANPSPRRLVSVTFRPRTCAASARAATKAPESAITASVMLDNGGPIDSNVCGKCVTI